MCVCVWLVFRHPPIQKRKKMVVLCMGSLFKRTHFKQGFPQKRHSQEHIDDLDEGKSVRHLDGF